MTTDNPHRLENGRSDLQLANYKLKLRQVEAALTADPETKKSSILKRPRQNHWKEEPKPGC